jgi:hypothetical protein
MTRNIRNQTITIEIVVLLRNFNKIKIENIQTIKNNLFQIIITRIKINLAVAVVAII